MTLYIFIILMLLFSFTDIMYLIIPNWIVLPAIIFGGVLTGHWISTVSMFCIGAYLFRKRLICGGDVKLMAMVGAFLGIWAIPAFILSKMLILWFRNITENQKGALPYAPFIGIACVPFLFL